MSVGSGSYCKQFVSERHVQSSRNGISADHDRAQWIRVRRRRNSDHHKNGIKTHEAKDKDLCGMATSKK
jgi:hypothetical protein